ncbi:MAG TPA: AGE family epimerase/isomerase [Pyrinomonadaceae bacterium]|nr:AGE family epimerase/isomerase [Pyrinomonadaceae bacterium]
MNRRGFLKHSTGVGALLVTTFDVRGSQRKETKSVTQGKSPGLNLGQLRDQYRRDLFTDFLPFMESHVIDHERGGFMCNTDHMGARSNENKNSWFEGRGTWVYSFLYNNLAREQKYLDVARRSVQFTLKSKPQQAELWPKELTREGKPLTSADGEIYGDLFIAEGLAEYSKATGEARYWNTAREILLKCLDLYDRPDYRPTIGQTYLGPTAKSFPGARIQGVWMVVIRLVTQMLEMRADDDLEKVADRCIDAITKHHYNPEFGLINELLNHDLTRPTDEYAQLVYTGHSIENLWMLMFEATRRRDKKLFETCAAWFKRHVEIAWDDVYGGVFRNLQNVERNVWLVDKVLWLQEEVLIGSLFIYEQTGAEWAKGMFERMYKYVLEKYPLRSHGSPLWMFASDRKVTYEAFLKMPKRVENFHHPRHLMLNLLSIERMMKRTDRRNR